MEQGKERIGGAEALALLQDGRLEDQPGGGSVMTVSACS